MRGALLRHQSLMTRLSLRCLRGSEADIQPTVTNNDRLLRLIYQCDSAVRGFTASSSPELLLLPHVGKLVCVSTFLQGPGGQNFVLVHHRSQGCKRSWAE